MITLRAEVSGNPDHDLGQLGLDLGEGQPVRLDVTFGNHHVVGVHEEVMLIQTEEFSEQSLDPVALHCLADFFAHRCSQSIPLSVVPSGPNIDQKVCTEIFPALPVAEHIVTSLRDPV